MRVTNEEATKVVCPQTVGSDAQVGCIGQNCMAWRWSRIERKTKQPPTHDFPHGRIVIEALGYCGLAGRPEEHSP